ncbi:hypothetical protein ACIA5D_03035 [Actinoplanes sp. NPDC051513]|uniref:hypothetical protein n=1 Tax=Actinoplanes sp. NPDC051513 TaxID=3363908 RepID=UPI0037B209CE
MTRRTIALRALIRAVATLAAVAAVSAGCGSPSDDWTQPHPMPTAVGVLGAGFVDPSATPTPEGTVTPKPGSWNDVHPSKGYRVVLLTAGHDAPTNALIKAVQDWAVEEDVSLRTIAADGDHVAGITKAIGMKPDLIVSAGNDLVDALAVVTASHLSQQFLVVGAEVAEPTQNVTASDWSGASFRGEGLGASSAYDPASFTEQRCAAAIRAGVAAVLHNLTGIVIWLDKI